MGRDLRGEMPLGTVLGEAYRLTRRIADGGMGTVYEAEHLRLGRRCAVKVLARDLAQNREALTRFHREVEITSQLNHPHIVQVVDFGSAPGGEPFLVMEYLDGEDLAQRLRRMGRMTPAATLHVVKQVASALAATHAGGIVHRDLKPANIFLIAIAGAAEAESNFVKVVDFGISKVLHEGPGLTRASVLMGTPHYMPPEQAAGRLRDIDHRSDQWALACIAWEMLAGHVPFQAKDVTALLFQIVHEDPLPEAARAAGLPAPVFEALGRALSKRPGDRFPSITAFARAFEAGVTAPPRTISGLEKTEAVPTPASTARPAQKPAAASRSPWSLGTIFGGKAPAALKPLAAAGERFRATVFRSLGALTPVPRRSAVKTLMDRLTPELFAPLRPRRKRRRGRRWWALAVALPAAAAVVLYGGRNLHRFEGLIPGRQPTTERAAAAATVVGSEAAGARADGEGAVGKRAVSWASLERQLARAFCAVDTRKDGAVVRGVGAGKTACPGIPRRTPVQKAIVEAFDEAAAQLAALRPAGAAEAAAIAARTQRRRRYAEVVLGDAEYRRVLLDHLRPALARRGYACADCPGSESQPASARR
jgi:serine/threonine protein kinase